MKNRSRVREALQLVALAGLHALAGASASAEVYLTTDEALALAFPDCTIERGSIYLTDEQRRAASELAGEPVTSRVLHPYVATCPKSGSEPGSGGTAYFEVHRVRTLPETLMVVVTPDDQIRRIEILRFDEPPDYIPSDAWYGQFDAKTLDDDLDLKRDIRPVTGATLTAQATTAAVRRVLALHTVTQVPSDGETP